MGNITAGETTDSTSAASGNIATSASTIDVTTSETETLAGSSLNGATGVNIVNSTNGAVADGVNIWASPLNYVDRATPDRW